MKSKAACLLSLLSRRPEEFCERVAESAAGRLEPILRRPPAYETTGLEAGISAVLRCGNTMLAEIFSEGELVRIEADVPRRIAELPANAPFDRSHNGDTALGRLCYAMTRALRPRIVVETGVCYGVTSAYILAALEANAAGHLYSIDLPPLGESADDFVGWLVPKELRRRWTVQRGTSARLLRPLLAHASPIGIFIHDSLHTFRNMSAEFQTAWPALEDGGILISDDIEGNHAFMRLTRVQKPQASVVIREENKKALIGIAVKRK